METVSDLKVLWFYRLLHTRYNFNLRIRENALASLRSIYRYIFSMGVFVIVSMMQVIVRLSENACCLVYHLGFWSMSALNCLTVQMSFHFVDWIQLIFWFAVMQTFRISSSSILYFSAVYPLKAACILVISRLMRRFSDSWRCESVLWNRVWMVEFISICKHYLMHCRMDSVMLIYNLRHILTARKIQMIMIYEYFLMNLVSTSQHCSFTSNNEIMITIVSHSIIWISVTDWTTSTLT